MTDFHRTNLNLYPADVDFLRSRYGTGWTVKLREIIHDHVTNKQRGNDMCFTCFGKGEIFQSLGIYATCPSCKGTGYHAQ